MLASSRRKFRSFGVFVRAARLDGTAVSRSLAIRDALAVGAALAIGLLGGSPAGATLLGTGAINAAMADGPVAIRLRLVRIVSTAAVLAVAAFVAQTTAQVVWLGVLAATLCGFCGAFVAAAGPDARTVGITIVATFIVLGGSPLPVERALPAAGLVLGGGAVVAIFAALAIPARTSPERRALADAYDALASDPAAGTALAAARVTLREFALRSDRGDEALRTLLDRAEAIRDGMLLLADWSDDASLAGAAAAGTIARRRAAIVAALRAIAVALRDGRATLDPPAIATGLAVAGRPDSHALAATGPLGAAHDRAYLRVASALRQAAEAAADVRESAGHRGLLGRLRPPTPPLRGALVTLRANVSLRSSAFRHALRLAAAVLLAETLWHATALPHGYWLPMTAALILRPGYDETVTRTIARIAGTLLGIVASAAIARVMGVDAALRIALVALAMGGMRGIGQRNYGVLSFFVTILVVELLSFVGVGLGSAIADRAIGTLGGGAIALCVYALWPTLSRKRLPALYATLFAADRAYWAAVAARLTRPDAVDEERLVALRGEARRARSETVDAVDAARDEPGARRIFDLAAGRLEAAHRFALGAYRLEALRGELRPDADRDRLADEIGTALDRIGRRLGGEFEVPPLPDLTSALHAIAVRAVAAPADRLFVAEADAMVDALETIATLAAAPPHR